MSKKLKKNIKFNINDLVFAKVKGYSPWPAKIVTAGPKYKVTFFGTGEIGLVKEDELYNYEDNREAFKTKFGKRKNYQKALNEIAKCWNYKKESETPLVKAKDDPGSSSKSEDPAPGQAQKEISGEESVAVPSVTESKVSLEQIEVPTPEQPINEATATKSKEETEVTEENITAKRSIEEVQTDSPPAKRLKPDSELIVKQHLDDLYLEDNTLKFEINKERFTAYTAAGLQKLKLQHEELSKRNTKTVKEDECCFMDEKSVAILYEPSINPVAFGIFITRHRPNKFDTIEERLRSEIKIVNDVHSTVTDLKKQTEPIDIVTDDNFLCLADFQQLISHVKIILEREEMPNAKVEVIAKELCLLKIILAIRENVPAEIQDENCLVKALSLLKLVKSKYEISFMTAMKHPVIVDCFFSLTKYIPKAELRNKEIVGQIQQAAQTILDSVRDNIKHLSEDDFKNSFWKPYVRCVKTFQRALPINRFDFMGITSLEEYNSLLKTHKESAKTN